MTKRAHYIYLAVAIALTTIVASSCSSETDMPTPKGGNSLSLQFMLTPTSYTRAATEETVDIYYTIQDGKATLDSAIHSPTTRATTPGDGTVADGGGMADLTVFLVDGNDNIVGRESFTTLSGTDATVKSITFDELEIGSYTIYAYANSEGNDWFSMPQAGETSFANYKDAVLKPLNGTSTPTIDNGRMPLTGKQEIAISYGDNSATVEMLRPVTQLSLRLKNERETAINATAFSLGNIFPTSGYVFEHSDILEEGSAYNYAGNTGNNNYHPLPNTTTQTPLIPGIERLYYDALIYENKSDEGYKITLTFTENIEINENIIDKINEKNITTFIKLKDQDLYLRLNEDERSLEMVPSTLVDDRCHWLIGGAGQQNRDFLNNNNTKPLYLHVNGASGYSFTTEDHKLRFGYQNDNYFSIGDGSYWLKYDANNNSFTTAKDGPAIFGFTTMSQSGNNNSFTDTIKITETNSSEIKAQTSMLRNQKINLNLIFQ